MKDAILAVVVLALVGSNLYLATKYAAQSNELGRAQMTLAILLGVGREM
jgi:hypothetical protein